MIRDNNDYNKMISIIGLGYVGLPLAQNLLKSIK